MPCPYYRSGACYSPKVDRGPNDLVVAVSRCLGSQNAYTSCLFYVDPQSNNSTNDNAKKSGIEPKKRQKIYAPIHLMTSELKCDCEYYGLENIENGYVASCKILKRYLTKYEAKICAGYWEQCPYRIMSIKRTHAMALKHRTII